MMKSKAIKVSLILGILACLVMFSAGSAVAEKLKLSVAGAGIGKSSYVQAAALGDVTWSEPQPYVHIHMALSGGPGKTEEILVGHLSAGQVQGMFADIYEFV